MIMEQLSLIELLNNFNPQLANWKPGVDNHKYCEILAYIPADALSPIEQSYSGPTNDLKEYRHRLWCNHALAINDYLGVNAKWEEAISLLGKHRKANLPIGMKITEWRMKYFMNTQVVKYL